MSKILKSAILAVTLVVSSFATAGGNTKTYSDEQDAPYSPLDIAQASFDHTKKALKGTITTYDPFDVAIFADPANNFFVDINTKKGRSFLVIYHNGTSWAAEVYEMTDDDVTFVGMATAGAYGIDGVSYKVKRKLIPGARKVKKAWWFATTSYMGGAGACAVDTCYDDIPNDGIFMHKI